MRVGDNLDFLDAEHDATSASDALDFRASTPIRIIRWGVIVTVEITGTSAVLALDVSRHAADGTATREDAAGTTTITVVADEVGAIHFTEPAEADEVLVKPGDIVHMQVTTAMGTAGDFVPFIQYQKLNWDETGANANFNDATPTTRMVDATT
jgi:hypothetical protein